MKKLETFSLYITLGQMNTGGPYGFWFRQNDIYAIIKALPQSVENLELDTKGYDLFKTRDRHLCELISERGGRLKHVRLRISRICKHILPQEHIALSTIVIKLIQPHTRSATKVCGDAPDDTMIWAGSEDQINACTDLRRSLVSSLRDIIASSASIVSAVILNPSPEDFRDQGKRKVQLPTLNRYDIKATQILSEPVTIEQMPHNFEIRHRIDQLDKDVRGNFSKLEELLEGSLWIETTKGVRLPTAC